MRSWSLSVEILRGVMNRESDEVLDPPVVEHNVRCQGCGILYVAFLEKGPMRVRIKSACPACTEPERGRYRRREQET